MGHKWRTGHRNFILRFRIAWELFKAMKHERAGQFFCNRFQKDEDIFYMSDVLFLKRMRKEVEGNNMKKELEEL